MKPDFDFAGESLQPGLSVIEASAGTGKTHAISHLVPRFLLDGAAKNLGQILLVTFTNDAARELAERTRRVLERLYAQPSPDEAKLDSGLHQLRKKFGAAKVTEVAGQALLDLDLLGVSTIHSFCQKVLQTEGTLCGLPAVPELIPDDADLADQALRDLWESVVAGSRQHANLATAMKWNIEDDLKFLKTALPLDNPTTEPPVLPFADRMAELQGFPLRFNSDICSELLDIVKKVPVWAKGAAEESVRSRLSATLSGAESLDAPGFLEAVLLAADLPSWINGQGKEGKVIKARATESRAVVLANELIDVAKLARWSFRNECVTAIRQRVDQSLNASRQITYDGLINTLRDALHGGHGDQLAARLRSRYNVALIDESQDTDARQMAIFRKIFVGENGTVCKDHRLVLVGDPKQAIYAFRGADVNTYIAARDLAGERLQPLTKTFRSPEPLVRASNALFSRTDTFLKEGLTFTPATSGLVGDRQLLAGGETDSARVECWIVPDDGGEDYCNRHKRDGRISATVASEIVRLLQGGAQITDGTGGSDVVRPGDFAVLVSTGAHAAAVAEALMARNVPAVRAGSDDIMASEEASELLTIVRAMHEPRRTGVRLAALATRMLGVSSRKIRSTAFVAEDEQWMEHFLQWQEAWQHEGIASAIARMDSAAGTTARLASLDRGERRVTNFRQLTDLLEAASIELQHDTGRVVLWFSQEFARAEGSSLVEERQLQLQSDADAVKIVTMHSSKGLQYPLVFCPFLWDSKEPKDFQKLAGKDKPPCLVDTKLADEATMAAIVRAGLEDRIRLAYVAVTRAQVKVWIYGGEICGGKNRPAPSALDWILRSDSKQDFSPWVEVVKTAGRGGRHAAGLQALAAEAKAEDVIFWKEPPEPSDQRWERQANSEATDLKALPSPKVPPGWVLTSFSALTREKDPHAGEAFPSFGADHKTIETPRNSFFDAPGGTLVGSAVHDWIERWDFGAVEPAGLKSHFAKYPLPPGPPAFHERVSGMLEELRGAVLAGMGCSIGAACPNASASEWHFQLPIQETLSADAIASVFREHGNPEYADALGALPAEDLRGYLHGFLDRIAFHNGKWGVIDWKTNNLGASPAACAQASLMDCAIHSHYLLQTHLYLVALRRWLGPEAEIAGAWLVFLRGVAAGTDAGILHIKPEPQLMASLDGLFAAAASVP